MVGKGNKKKKPLHEYPEKTVGTRLFAHMGMDSLRLHSIWALDDNVILSFAANTVQFVNVATGNITCTPGPEGGGVGAVCVHPTRQFYTVCEKHPKDPNAIVYEYPSRKVRSTLRKGAERGYSACRFSESGAMLATVAIEPDFVLTIWAWEQEQIILRNKAFGADVYNVAFNRFNDGLIVTSGSGHVKFWSMANTFTGLKLQGHVGKFGRTEISDISAFVSMPDGKVVSASESGMLLLWEGNLIKCELGRAQPANEEAPVGKCHDGNILVVELVEQNRLVMTGGDDGFLRYWALDEMDAAENTGTEHATAIRMLVEVFVGEGVKVRCVTRSVDGQHWIILDSAGAIRKVQYMTYDAIMHAANNAGGVVEYVERAPLLRFNAGGVLALAPSPIDHTCVTGGQDGTLRQLDYITRSEAFQVKFGSAVTDTRYITVKGDAIQRTLLATFHDGSVRILRRARNTFEIVSQSKPHSAPIVAWAVDRDLTQLWTIAQDKTAFYFKVSPKLELEPVGFCELPEAPTCAEFSQQNDRLFVGFKSGNIIALAAPSATAVDPAVGFKFQASWQGVGYRQKQKPPEKEKRAIIDGVEALEASSSDDDLLAEEEDKGPWAVRFITQLPHGTMLVGLDQPELTYEYNLSTRYPDNAMGPPPLPPSGIEPAGRVEEPMRNLAYRDTIIRGATVSHTKATLVLRTHDSGVIMRPTKRLEACTHATQLHDALERAIAAADMSYDERVLLTVGTDGMVFAHAIGDIPPPEAADVASPDALPAAALPKVAPIPHSIQRQKELDDQHKAEEAAMSKKEHLMRKVRSIHNDFNRILDENEAAAGGQKLNRDELVLDPKCSTCWRTRRSSRSKRRTESSSGCRRRSRRSWGS
jgi:WD40 repeat protein